MKSRKEIETHINDLLDELKDELMHNVVDHLKAFEILSEHEGTLFVRREPSKNLITAKQLYRDYTYIEEDSDEEMAVFKLNSKESFTL